MGLCAKAYNNFYQKFVPPGLMVARLGGAILFHGNNLMVENIFLPVGIRTHRNKLFNVVGEEH